MSRVQRKDARKPTKARAYLYSADGWPLGECEMKDVSSSGARLAHEISDELPETFMLALSRNGQVRRRCKVAWKKDNEIGVRFVKD
jgi:hypothetical protein